ncbi:MAG TPA: hypothetical protein VNK44_04095 [Candidatus Nitrosotenuis sp.]|nr:hypothetical protein [Candidatus Nitrosotenuis sp.]
MSSVSLSSLVADSYAVEQNGVIMTPFTEQPPTIDGRWTTSTEWNDASETLITSGSDQIYLRVKPDRDFVYVMVDVITAQLVMAPNGYKV